MLYSVDADKCLTTIPHLADFQRWRARLSDAEFKVIVDELNAKVDGGTIHTSSWMPGNNWAGTVFDPIYQKACDQDETASARCFGLFLWVVMVNRPETWAFGRYKLKDIPIEGLTYFIVDKRC